MEGPEEGGLGRIPGGVTFKLKLEGRGRAGLWTSGKIILGRWGIKWRGSQELGGFKKS